MFHSFRYRMFLQCSLYSYCSACFIHFMLSVDIPSAFGRLGTGTSRMVCALLRLHFFCQPSLPFYFIFCVFKLLFCNFYSSYIVEPYFIVLSVPQMWNLPVSQASSSSRSLQRIIKDSCHQHLPLSGSSKGPVTASREVMRPAKSVSVH